MKRLLFLNLGPYFNPTEIAALEYYQWLSREFEGDVFAVVHKKEYRSFTLGNFHLVGLYLPRWARGHTFMRDIAYVIYVFTRGLTRHLFRQKYDVVICKEPLVTGVISVGFAKIGRLKSLVQLNGNYAASFVKNAQLPSLGERMRHAYGSAVIPWVARHADGIKLLYGKQQEMLRFADHSQVKHVFVFSNFVPIGRCSPGEEGKGYVLFCGYPWHLKGVDVLIRAFQLISPEFPEISLKVVGYCPDRTEF